jgi:hypothetical protein
VRLDAREQPVQLGLVAHRPVEDGLDGAWPALQPFQPLECGAAHAATDADLVGRITHR